MKKTVIWALISAMLLGVVFTVLPVSAQESAALPKAPISVEYRLDKVGDGSADGVVTVTLPAGHGAEDIHLYWGDDNGKLPGYTALSPFKVSGNIVAHRMASGSYIPQGATRLLAYTYSDEKGLSEGYASVDLPENAALTDAQLGTLLFEFQSVSDIHLTRSYSPRLHHSDHMRAMLEDIIKVSPNSIGIFNNGDTVNNGYDADYEEFLMICAEYEDAPVIYSGFGNHELFTYGTDKKFPTTNEAFQEMKDAYWSYLGYSVPEDASFCGGTRFGSLCYSFVRNDCKFIFLGTDVLNQNYLTLNNSTLKWLENELKAGKGNPTFVIMHQPLPATLAGTFKANYGVTTATANALKEMLAEYPEVIMFNGHSHRDLNQYATNYVRDEKLPNIFGTSSVGYLARAYDSAATETYKGSEGYYVYVYEDKVLVRGRDFLKGEWVASAQFIVDLSEEALNTVPEDEVEAPLYGGTADLSLVGNSLSGTVHCNMPINNNATNIALFFSSKDTGIIGSDPFATIDVDSKDNFFSCDIQFADVQLPYTADYILIYSYSNILGWSADCDIIDLSTLVKGGGMPASGNFSMNKYSFEVGEPILVTAYKNTGTSWIGIRNVESDDAYKTWNQWKIADVGIGTTVDVSKDHSAFKYDFTALEPGTYEIAWIEKSGTGFLASKTPENTTTFVVQEAYEGNVSSSGAVKTNKSFYRLGEPIYVTATKGTSEDWIGVQLTTVSTGTKLWYKLGVSGVNEEFNIVKKSNYTGVDGTDYKFEKLEPGTYQLAWVSSSKTNFQTGKLSADTVKFTVIDMSEMLLLGVPVGDGITDPNTAILDIALFDAANKKAENFTPESWQALQEAVAAAEALLEGTDYTQAAIDAAYESVMSALSALVAVPNQPSNPQNPDDPSEDTSEEPEETEPTTDEAASTTELADGEGNKIEQLLGCGGMVTSAPFCLMFALLPAAFKKKKAE